MILDLNKICFDCVKSRISGPLRNPTSVQGVHYGRRGGYIYMYIERPYLHKFLGVAFKVFDVAIWTCARKPRTNEMMNLIFSEEERRKFKFVFTQEDTFDTGIQRPDITDGKATILLKELQTVWSRFPDKYDPSNTILIDDSPLKAFSNLDVNGLFPSPFSHNGSDETFLPEILWPCLRKLSRAFSVQHYLTVHYPKWSAVNLMKDRERQAAIYALLREKWGGRVRTGDDVMTILDVTPEEIPWDGKDQVQFYPPLELWTEDAIRDTTQALLGNNYSGPYRQNCRQFIWEVLQTRDLTNKFVNFYPRDACDRDMRYDESRTRLTCSNEYCVDC